jgi:uncharacterized protein (TIGR03084 family)
MTVIFDDLEAELDRLEGILAGLTPEQWETESGAPGWTITDVVLHLAQTNETVVTSAAVGAAGAGSSSNANWRQGAETLDEAVDRRVQAERAPAEVVFHRWRASVRDSVAALRQADPNVRLAWAAWPLKPATLATTRIAEHWAHALDITGPLAIAFPDSDRLRHIAWLGHSTLPYAFQFEGQEFHPVYCELTAPDGATVWRFGPPDAESTVTGAAGAFCRVGARRLAPADSRLITSGPYADAALAVLRNYAG